VVITEKTSTFREEVRCSRYCATYSASWVQNIVRHIVKCETKTLCDI